MEELLEALKDIKRELEEIKASKGEHKVEKQVYDVNEVAIMLDCNPRTIYDLISQGQLKCRRIGKAIRIPKMYYEEFIRGEQGIL